MPFLIDSRGSSSTTGLNIRTIVASLMQDVKTGVLVELVSPTPAYASCPNSNCNYYVFKIFSKGVPVGLVVSPSLGHSVPTRILTTMSSKYF